MLGIRSGLGTQSKIDLQIQGLYRKTDQWDSAAKDTRALTRQGISGSAEICSHGAAQGGHEGVELADDHFEADGVCSRGVGLHRPLRCRPEGECLERPSALD